MPKIADFPYTNAQVLDLAKQFPTPFHLYHEETIRNTVRGLNKAFSWCPGYKNHFAVKATPNPHIMQILKEEGRVAARHEKLVLSADNLANMIQFLTDCLFSARLWCRLLQLHRTGFVRTDGADW